MCISLIQKRRTMRQFLDRPVEQQTLHMIVEAALRSPSSRNLRPWEFMVVSDRKLLEQLSRSKPRGAGFLRGAAAGIVVVADPARSDVWIEDASIASLIIQFAAESLGLGACWVQIRNRMHGESGTAGDYIAEQLGLPPGVQVESIIGIGYPGKGKKPHGRETLLFEKVHHNRYGTPFHIEQHVNPPRGSDGTR